MPLDAPFRIALLAVIAMTMSVAAYHRVKARTGERISRREEGLALAITLRLAGLAVWLGTLAWLVNPRWMAWAELPLPLWLRWVGAGLGTAAAVLMYFTLTALGKNLTDTVVTRQDATLVTHGPYRYVRHPFYATAGLLIAAIALLSANAAIAAAGVLVLLLLAVRTPNEERRLLAKFGEPYRAYREATGAVIPKLRRRP
jgi:protein-S-isoprenylcysteine O-methyltransferase Ste14